MPLASISVDLDRKTRNRASPMERFKKSLSISLLIHVAAILVALGLSHEVYHAKSGGSGGSGGSIVSVWVTDVISGRSAGEFTSPSATKRKLLLQASPQKSGIEHSHSKSSGEDGGTGGAIHGGSGTSAGSGYGGGEARSQDTLSKVWRRLDERKYYPMTAKKKGIEGKPKISFEINEDGSIKWIKLASSCGANILDEAAMETARRAEPLPYYPAPITVTLNYSLSE